MEHSTRRPTTCRIISRRRSTSPRIIPPPLTAATAAADGISIPTDAFLLNQAAHDVSTATSSTTLALHQHSSSTLSLAAIEHNLEHSLHTVEQSIESVLTADADLYSDLTPEMEEMSLDVIGHDLILFLAASVLVEPLSRIINVTPVLLYLLLGFVAGPNGLSLFLGGTEVDAQIGDFGILFLLFVEGLNLSPERLKALGSFFSLGATQLLLSVGVIFFAFFVGGPMLLPLIQGTLT